SHCDVPQRLAWHEGGIPHASSEPASAARPVFFGRDGNDVHGGWLNRNAPPFPDFFFWALSFPGFFWACVLRVGQCAKICCSVFWIPRPRRSAETGSGGF